MKKIALLFALVWISFFSQAQQLPTDPETGRITFSEVVTAEGLTQKELRGKARSWVATAFNSGPHVLKLDAEDKMVIKGITKYGIQTAAGAAPSDLHFMMTIEFKDGRYKYETTDFSEDGIVPIEKTLLNPAVIYRKDGSIRAFNRSTVEAIRVAIDNLNNTLKKEMANAKKSSDW